jgi:hypothetical protein
MKSFRSEDRASEDLRRDWHDPANLRADGFENARNLGGAFNRCKGRWKSCGDSGKIVREIEDRPGVGRTPASIPDLADVRQSGTAGEFDGLRRGTILANYTQ